MDERSESKIIYRTEKYVVKVRTFCMNPKGAVVNENAGGITYSMSHAFVSSVHVARSIAAYSMKPVLRDRFFRSVTIYISPQSRYNVNKEGRVFCEKILGIFVGCSNAAFGL